MTPRILVVAAAILALPTAVQAQWTDRDPSQPATPRNVISIAPIALILGQVFAPEYERVLSPEGSFAVAAGFFDTDFDSDLSFDGTDADATYLRLEGKYRYYPRGVLNGIMVGASLGFTSVDGRIRENASERDFNAAGPSVGFEIGRARLYGASRRLYVGTLLGAKRIFWDVPEGVLGAYPTVRLAIGYAF